MNSRNATLGCNYGPNFKYPEDVNSFYTSSDFNNDFRKPWSCDQCLATI